MGDLYINREISAVPSIASYDYLRKTTSLSEHLAFRSYMDDFFVRILSLSSYLSHRFIHFIESLVLRDIGRCPQVSAFSYSGQHPSFSCSNNYQSVADDFSVLSCDLSDDGATLSVNERRANLQESIVVNANVDIVETKHGSLGVSSIIQGLILPLCGLRLCWRLAFSSCRRFFSCIRRSQIRFRSFISRVQKTLNGSSDDIGWLERAPELPPVVDGTAKFVDLLQRIRNGKHILPNSFVYLLIPGLFSNHGPLYFVSTKRFFSKMGLACHIAKIHSEAAVEHNAWELKQCIEELYWGSGKQVMLLGHSKGGVDAAAALSLYWSDLKDKVTGLALVQSPYGGTPIASDILREGQIGDKETKRIMELLICKLIKGDMRALEDLTYDKRKEFIMKHKLPEHIPLVSFHSEASIAPGVLATMSHIAHAELPWLPVPTFGSTDPDYSQSGCKVPVVVPIAAAMAVCALHLKLRYGEKSDGVVTCRDAEVPGSVVVHPDRKLDHAWMVYSSWNKNSSQPEASEMCEALLTMLVEIGQTRQEPEKDN